MKSIVKLMVVCCALLFTAQLSAQTTASTAAKETKTVKCEPANCNPANCTPEQIAECKKKCKDVSACKSTDAKAVKASASTAKATTVVALFPDFASKPASSCKPNPSCKPSPNCKPSAASVAKTEKKESAKLVLASNKQ